MAMIKIPTERQLAQRLGGLDRLLTAKRWEKAAIVWAFTHEGEVDKDPHPHTSGRMSIKKFASAGYSGLTSDMTVARYRKAWQYAIDAGEAPSVVPGDEIELPTIEWGATYDSVEDDSRYQMPDREALVEAADAENVGHTKVLDIAKNSKAMSAAIKGSPKVAKAAAVALHAQQARLRAATEEAIVVAVASANQVTVAQAKKTYTVDVARIRDAVEQEAVKREDFPLAKRTTFAKRMAGIIVGGRIAAAEEEERRKRTVSANWMHVDAKLGHAYQDLKEVLDYQQRGLLNLPDEETELMHDSFSKLKALVGLIDLAFTGSSDIDWDAEMEKLS